MQCRHEIFEGFYDDPDQEKVCLLCGKVFDIMNSDDHHYSDDRTEYISNYTEG